MEFHSPPPPGSTEDQVAIASGPYKLSTNN